MAGEQQQQQKEGSKCSCKFTSTEAMFIMNILDLFVAICMVWRGIQLILTGQFDFVVRGIWTVLIGAVVFVMVFFVFQILYSYFKFMLTFFGRGLLYMFFASVIGSASDTFGVIIYFGFYAIGGVNVFAQFGGLCGCFPLRYPRPFFMAGVNIGGQKMGVNYESEAVKKDMADDGGEFGTDTGSDFGNNTGGGVEVVDRKAGGQLQNPFEDHGGAYGGRA